MSLRISSSKAFSSAVSSCPTDQNKCENMCFFFKKKKKGAGKKKRTQPAGSEPDLQRQDQLIRPDR